MKYDHIKKAFREYLDSMTAQELREELESKYGFEFSKPLLSEKYKSTDTECTGINAQVMYSFSYGQGFEIDELKLSKIKTEADIDMSEHPNPKAA